MHRICWVVCLAGCQWVYGLEDRDAGRGDSARLDAPRIPDARRADAPRPPADALPPITPYLTTTDLDGDGLVGSADLCPTISAAVDPGSQVDDDGDGVGNSCDPNPSQRDCIVLADDLGDGLDGRWTTSGNWTFQPNQCTNYNSDGLCGQADGGVAWLYASRDLGAEVVEVQVGQVSNAGGSGESFYVGSELTAAADLTGEVCGYGAAADASLATLISDLDDGARTIEDSAPNSTVLDPQKRFVVRWRTGSTCKADAVSAVDVDPAPPLANGRVGIRIENLVVTLHSVVVYSQRCAAP